MKHIVGGMRALRRRAKPHMRPAGAGRYEEPHRLEARAFVAPCSSREQGAWFDPEDRRFGAGRYHMNVSGRPSAFISRCMAWVLAAVFLASGPASSAAGDVLDQWLDQVIEQNQDVLAARKEWESAQQRIRATRSFDDPMVGVDFMRMDSTDFDDVDETEFMVSQRLPWFGKRRARTDTAALLADAAGFRYLEVVRNTRAEVTRAYWNLWLARRALSINEENRELLRSFAQIAEARYESGVGIQADMLKAQVALAELKSELAALRADAAVAEGKVNRLLSLPAETEHRVPDEPELPVLRWTLDEAYHSARMYCCILMSFLFEWQAREAMVREAQLAYRPDFEFRVAARRQSGRDSINEYDAGIAINVPWLWRGKYRSAINEAEHELERAQAKFLAEQDMTFLETKEAHAGASSAWETVNLFEESVLPQSRALVESTKAAYENGEIGFLDLIDAQRQWNNALLAEARARARYASYMADLLALVQPWQDYEIETGLISEEMLH